MKRFKLVASTFLGGLLGLGGLVGALGLCSTPALVAVFAAFGLNSMLLATYNKIFLFFGLVFFSLAVYFYRRRNSCLPAGKAGPPEEKTKFSRFEMVGLWVLIAVGALLIISNLAGVRKSPAKVNQAQEAATYLKFKEIKASLIPAGTPEFYGQILGISFDKAQEAINAVSPFDPTYGSQKIVLIGKELERYKKIGSQIACEYCCGAKTLVFENGEAACGCDHSQMMRGLAAWLLKNYPGKYTNEEILAELKKWKAVFFPQQTLAAKIGELEKAGEPGIKELLEEFPDFLPKMVGGC